MNQQNDTFIPAPSPILHSNDNGATKVGKVIESPTDNEDKNAEEKEIAEVKTQHRLTPKFTKWQHLFFDKTNKKTYMNKTQSAILAYNLDPVKDYAVAGSMGYQNFKKLQNVASQIAEEKGYTADKWLDKGWLQALKSESPEWWDRIGDTLGFRSLKPQVMVQQNTQNIINVNGEEQKAFNDQFRDFIKAR